MIMNIYNYFKLRVDILINICQQIPIDNRQITSTQIQGMLNKKQGLKLNSYKIDTDALQNSLRQLSSIKSQMETTISHYKSQQDHLLIENQRLKQQISMLQKKTLQKAEHSECQTKILKIETELKQKKKQIQKLTRLVQDEKKNKDIISSQYEKKLQKYIKQNRITTDNYQQRMAVLNIELKQLKVTLDVMNSEKDSMRKIIKQKQIQNQELILINKNLRQNYDRQYSQISLSHKNESIISAGKFYEKSDNLGREQKKIISEIERQSRDIYDKYKSQSQSQYIPLVTSKKQKGQIEKQEKYNKPIPSFPSLPPKYPNYDNHHKQLKTTQNINEKKESVFNQYSYTTPHLPNNEEQQAFEASIRKLYHQIKDLGITARQAKVLPQFKKMKTNQNPSRKDLYAFLKSPPIQQNEEEAEKNLNYIQNSIKNKHGKVTGNFVTELIIAKIEQYQNISKLNTEDLQVSGMTPSISKQSESYAKQEFDRGSSYQQYATFSRPSIKQNLSQSFF